MGGRARARRSRAPRAPRPGRAEFFDEAAARLKRTVPFDGACWHTLDPGSDLITQHRLQDLPDRFPILANNEYAVDDVNKFAHLASRRAQGGDAERGDRRPPGAKPALSATCSVTAGLGPELRSAFVADGSTWGALILVRRAGRPEFEERDVELLASASALFARAVRRGLVAEACEPIDRLPEAPGVVELDASGDPDPDLLVCASRSSKSFRAARSRQACARLRYTQLRTPREPRSPTPVPWAQQHFPARQ